MIERSLIVERSGAVALFRLNRPSKANALDAALVDALIGELRAVAEDQTIEALIITGTGSFFCAGGDLTMLTRWHDLNSHERRQRFVHGQEVATLLASLPIPVVSAVNGPAIGAGFDLAIAADFCVAATSAWFQSGFATVGLVPDLGGSWLLPRIVGLARARQLILANKRIDAATAEAWGIAIRVVPNEDVVTAATELAIELLRSSTRPAIAAAKRALADAASQSLEQSLAHAAATQDELMDTVEHRRRAGTLLDAWKDPKRTSSLA